MKITMGYEEYNKLMTFAKQFAAKPGGFRPITEYIRLTASGNTVFPDVIKAEALDGYKVGCITVPVNDCSADGEMLIPVTPKLKKTDVYAVITESESGKEIEIRTATGATVHRKPDGEFLNVSNIYPQDEPAEVFGYNPSLLAEALKAFSSDKAVRIEYRGALRPIVIKSGTAQAIVMPVRLK